MLGLLYTKMLERKKIKIYIDQDLHIWPCSQSFLQKQEEGAITSGWSTSRRMINLDWQRQEGKCKKEVCILTREMLYSPQAWPPAGSCQSSEPGPVRISREHPVPTLPPRQNPPEVSRAPKILCPFPMS